MTKTNILFALLYLAVSLSSCKAQTKNRIHVSKIIFHSSRCNGTCPRIDLEIDSTKNLFVDREYFKTKSETDKRYSGQFQGTLIETDYNKLIELLQNCNLDTLKFPDITCCDAVITTIIVYYNGQRKYLKSMTPPNEANELIGHLILLGNNKKLKRTSETKNMEY